MRQRTSLLWLTSGPSCLGQGSYRVCYRLLASTSPRCCPHRAWCCQVTLALSVCSLLVPQCLQLSQFHLVLILTQELPTLFQSWTFLLNSLQLPAQVVRSDWCPCHLSRQAHPWSPVLDFLVPHLLKLARRLPFDYWVKFRQSYSVQLFLELLICFS